jgi:hypothetical protein
VSAGGLALFHGLTITSRWTALLPGLVLGGVGIGIANPAIATIALGVVPPQRSGMASGISNTFRIGGVATGVAALGAVFQQRLESTLRSSLGHPAPGLASAVAAGGTHAAAAASRGRVAVESAARHAFVAGINDLVLVGAVTVFIGAVFAALVRRKDFYSRRRAAAQRMTVEAAGSELVPEAVG